MSQLLRSVSLPLVMFGMVSCTGVAKGQTTGYTSALLRSFQNQNNGTQFTTSRIQQQSLGRAVTRTGVAGVNLRAYEGPGSLGNRSKPFSNVNRGPSVSPYLALSNPFSTPTDYYNVVRPLQEQRRMNERVAQQQYQQAKKLNEMAARGPYSVRGDYESAPTGHVVTRMYYANFMQTGEFFPPPTNPKQR